MARFFIDRPIFAWVIAILISLIGTLSIIGLPIAQYPSIAPPSIAIMVTYPGASAETVEDTVTQVIEQQMNGLDGLRYMSATSESTGSATIVMTFNNDVDPDIAQVQVQNKLALAQPMLPQAVQDQGINVVKYVRNFMMVVAFVSEDGSMDAQDLGDYAASLVKDPLSRVSGVGEIILFSSQYAMRIWLDANELNRFGLTPADVEASLQAENAQISAGALGDIPASKGQEITATVNVQDRLNTPEEFGDIRLRTLSDGSTVHLRDVARIEYGAETYTKSARYNGHPAAAMAIRLASGANALNTEVAVKAKLSELSKFFPEGMKVRFPYDTTPFVRISIHEVVKTLLEAVVLVFFVMLLFLQSLRATIIPTIAVPVVLLGTFGVLSLFGYSINTLTLFAMVLAIGLLVDDAIVVVENVERVMREEGLPPREATRKSMDQITGALVGIALVLSAVFLPMAFFGGSTGVIFRQFSVTIVSAMLLSVFVALTLTPALAATILKPVKADAHSRGFFGWFNRNFERTVHGYTATVGTMVHHRWLFLGVYALLTAGMFYMHEKMPTGFLPDEDQGILITQIQLPSGASRERTLEVVKQVEQYYMTDEKDLVNQVISVLGFSFAGTGQNMAVLFANLKDWDVRKRPDQKVFAMAGRAMGRFSQIRDAQIFAFPPPAVVELGTASGWDAELQDNAGLGHDVLMNARNQFLGMAAQDPLLAKVRPNGLNDEPQYRVDIDRTKVGALGLSLATVNDTVSVAWGSAYVDDFIHEGRVKKVYMQAMPQFRMQPEDLDAWYVRNAQGDMVPFSSFASGRWVYGSPRLERYNGVSSMELMGEPAPGISSGQAMEEVAKLAGELPHGIGLSWTGLSYEEQLAGSQASLLYLLSGLVVFLALAALYESWSVPFSVMLVVPIGILGAILAAMGRGLSGDIYFQVGLLTTIGLSAKNAILIVEFAKSLQEQGRDALTAAIEAGRMRIRPIVMTSLAFGFGVLPLAISNGAGSGGQHGIGTGVLGGVAASTLIGILFVPLFFVLIRGRMKTKPVDTQPQGVSMDKPAGDCGTTPEGK